MLSSPHIIWALIGFFFGMGCVWFYHTAKTRGVRYFWTHPLVTGSLLLILLYAIDSILTWLSVVSEEMSWTLTFLIIVPLVLVLGIFAYRRIMRQGADNKA